jgi:hypothetical protein
MLQSAGPIDSRTSDGRPRPATAGQGPDEIVQTTQTRPSVGGPVHACSTITSCHSQRLPPIAQCPVAPSPGAVPVCVLFRGPHYFAKDIHEVQGSDRADDVRCWLREVR